MDYNEEEGKELGNGPYKTKVINGKDLLMGKGGNRIDDEILEMPKPIVNVDDLNFSLSSLNNHDFMKEEISIFEKS